MPFFQNLVILFTRYPESGNCKTRLIPALGDDGAMVIHKQLVSHTLQQVAMYTVQNKGELEIYYDGESLGKIRSWLGKEHSYTKQQGNTIGERMAHAFSQTLPRSQNVILIGSDCPDITASLLARATNALTSHDMVIGPAHDGGYYLIGLAPQVNMVSCNALFHDIPWSTCEVFAKTMWRAKQQQLNTYTLPKLHDIDTPEDLKYFHHHPHSQ